MEIRIEDLTKDFEDGTRALNGIDLLIEDGMFGLLGMNASGKSTLMNILATLEKPSGGKVTVDGLDLARDRAKVRAMTGYLPQRFSEFTHITVWEFLDYTARLSGIRKKLKRHDAIDEMLDSLGLTPYRSRPANELSPVMKRHLEIAQAMIGSPRLLIIDEPTVGLSPGERLRFRKLLAEKTKSIEIIIMSTHILGDITSACSDMAILDAGGIVFRGAPEDLLVKAGKNDVIENSSQDMLDNEKTAAAVISYFTNTH